jgi:hypothetical protein
MKARAPSVSATPETTAPAPAAGKRPGSPRGNAALAEDLAAMSAGQRGEEVAMGRGHAAGMIAGFGIAAANALGGGGLPAMLNPNDYWDTYPESKAPALVQPAGSGLIRKAD